MFSYEKYQEIRTAKGLNDNKVSIASAVSIATISSWKTGRYTPKIDKLERIAKVLGVTPDAFRESE